MSRFNAGAGERATAQGKQRIALPRAGGVQPLSVGAPAFGQASIAQSGAAGVGIGGQITRQMGNVSIAGSFLAQQKQIIAREDLNKAMKKAAPIVNARLEQGLAIDPMGSELIAEMADDGAAIKASRDDNREIARRIALPDDHDDHIDLTPQVKADGTTETRPEATQRILSTWVKENAPPNWTEKSKGIYVSQVFDKSSKVITERLRKEDILVLQDTLHDIKETIAPDQFPSIEKFNDAWKTAESLTRALGMSEAQGKAALFGDAAQAAALSGNKNLLDLYEKYIKPGDEDHWAQLTAKVDAAKTNNDSVRLKQAQDDFTVSLFANPSSNEVRDDVIKWVADDRITLAEGIKMFARIDAHHAAKMKATKDQQLDTMVKSFRKGDTGLSPSQIEEMITARENHIDPQFAWSDSESKKLRAAYKEGQKRTVDARIVQNAIDSDGTGAPLTDDKMDAYGVAAINARYVTADGDDKPNTIVQPEALALWSTGTRRILPLVKEETMRSLNTARSPKAINMAVRAYAAHFRANPLFAAELKNGLNEQGKLRASAIEIEMKRKAPGLLTVQGDTGEVSASNAWLERSNEISELIFALDLPEGTKLEEMRKKALKIAKPEETSRADLITKLNQTLPQIFRESGYSWLGGQTLRVGENSVADYETFLGEETFYQMALNGGDAGAAIGGIKGSLSRLVAKRQPILWNGIATVEDVSPYAFSDVMEKQMVKDIKDTMKSGALTGTMDFYRENFRPKFQATGKARDENGDVITGYWALTHNETGLPLRMTVKKPDGTTELGIWAYTPKGVKNEKIHLKTRRELEIEIDERVRERKITERSGDVFGREQDSTEEFDHTGDDDFGAAF